MGGSGCGSACGAVGPSIHLSGGPVRSSARVLRHVPTHRPTTAPSNLARMSEKTQGFTEDQVEDFKEVFQLFDTKGDGLIQVTQVGDVLRALGQNPTEGDVKKLVQSTNSKGGSEARVTFETFLPLLQAVSGKKITDTVDDFVEGLRHFDKEGNGRISAIELRQLLTGLGEKMSEEEVEQLIHGKEDSQGNINYEEFVKMSSLNNKSIRRRWRKN